MNYVWLYTRQIFNIAILVFANIYVSTPFGKPRVIGQCSCGIGRVVTSAINCKPNDPEFQGIREIALVHENIVGKGENAALTVRFITKRFIGEYDQSADSKYKYSTIVDGEQMAFELLDTRSMNEDCGAREDVLKWADGYVLVYSVVSKKSFDLLAEIQRRVEEFRKGASVPIVVLGNKADLAHMRQVTQDEGQAFASMLGCPFIELSASEDVTNVTEAFHNLCRDIIEYKRRSRTFFDRVFGAFGREKVSS